MKKQDLNGLFGLKWNPFDRSLPTEGLVESKELTNFFWRIENLVLDGGYAMIVGPPGTGKSARMRLLANHLSKIPEIKIANIERPQSTVTDFYRELGEHFEISFKISNRWNGFKELRKRWINFTKETMFKPVLLIDESQEIPMQTLNEMRLLSSMEFDSKNIVTIIFSGDDRFPEKLRYEDLLPLASRINIKLILGNLSKEELKDIFMGSIHKAGGQNLVSSQAIKLITDHSSGNLRTMMSTANELLHEALLQNTSTITEKLFYDKFQIINKKVKR